MAEQITIAGHVFNVPTRYEEGHELTANEAAALNQTFHENLRNNFAKKVEDKKDGMERIEDDDVLTDLQSQLDEYAEQYEFGAPGARGARDPILSEAMKLAKDKIWEALRARGKKRKDVEASAVTELAKKYLAKHPETMQLARQRVAEAQAAASGDLEDLVANI